MVQYIVTWCVVLVLGSVDSSDVYERYALVRTDRLPSMSANCEHEKGFKSLEAARLFVDQGQLLNGVNNFHIDSLYYPDNGLVPNGK